MTRWFLFGAIVFLMSFGGRVLFFDWSIVFK